VRDLRHRAAGPWRAALIVGMALLVAALSGAAPAAAAEGEAAREAGREGAEWLRPAARGRTIPDAAGFYRGHLLPRLTSQFSTLGSYEALPARQADPSRNLVFEQAARAARLRARRGTKRALKGFLLESLPVGRLIERVELRRAHGGATADRGLRLGLAIRGGLPVAELAQPLGRGLLRTGLGVDGRVRLEYRGGQFGGVGLRADYDPFRGEFDLGCRLAF